MSDDEKKLSNRYRKVDKAQHSQAFLKQFNTVKAREEKKEIHESKEEGSSHD